MAIGSQRHSGRMNSHAASWRAILRGSHFMTRLATNATSDEHQPPLSLPALQDALAAVDPAVLVVSPRIVAAGHQAACRCTSGIGLRVPHRKTYVIDRDALLDDRRSGGSRPAGDGRAARAT